MGVKRSDDARGRDRESIFSVGRLLGRKEWRVLLCWRLGVEVEAAEPTMLYYRLRRGVKSRTIDRRGLLQWRRSRLKLELRGVVV